MSSAHLSKRLPLPLPRRDDVVLGCDKPGIVAVLGCNPVTAKASASLRRTLSADMSSRKWLAQNGFCPMKRDDKEDTQKKEAGRDTWGSILFQKVEDSKTVPPPYVHPMVKRSKSTLSTQSLEICTESLGSETGSDGFSSYPTSEVGDVEAEDGHVHEQPQQDRLFEEFYEFKYAGAARKTRPRLFPPPILSGPFSMYSCRDNGRLVLEAVSIPTGKNFEARREEGRLILTFATHEQSHRKDEEETYEEGEDELMMEMEEDISVDEDEDEQGKYNKVFDYEEDEEEKPILIKQWLSMSESALSAGTLSASLNAYEYFWRKKSPATTSTATTITARSSDNINEAWESQFSRTDGCLASSLHGCNSPSGTNLLWEPKCLAIS